MAAINSRFILGLAAGLMLGVSGMLVGNRLGKPISTQSPAPAAVAARQPDVPAHRLARSKTNLSTVAAEHGSSTSKPALSSRLARLLGGGERERLTVEEVAAYLRENRRSAGSLIGAFLATRDAAFLQEAAEKFPNDPRVQYQVLMDRGSTAEARSRAVAAFKQAAPENALGNYLAASEHLKSGRREEGIKELLQAAGKAKLQDFVRDSQQDLEEACLAAGWSAAEAKVQAAHLIAGLVLPQGSELRRLGRQMLDLVKAYQQAGDTTSAQNLTEMGLAFGRQVQRQLGADFTMNDSVGIAIESSFLNSLAPATVLKDTGLTVRERQAELLQRKVIMNELGQGLDEAMQRLNERELSIFYDRLKLYGELEALRWFRSRHMTP